MFNPAKYLSFKGIDHNKRWFMEYISGLNFVERRIILLVQSSKKLIKVFNKGIVEVG